MILNLQYLNSNGNQRETTLNSTLILIYQHHYPNITFLSIHRRWCSLMSVIPCIWRIFFLKCHDLCLIQKRIYKGNSFRESYTSTPLLVTLKCYFVITSITVALLHDGTMFVFMCHKSQTNKNVIRVNIFFVSVSLYPYTLRKKCFKYFCTC